MMKWFDRTFTFDLPIAAFQTVLERVRGTPARLEELIASIPRELWTAEPFDGWSIQEHVGHLGDLDELHDDRLEDYDARAERLRPADLKNRKTEEAGHNRVPMNELLARFRAGRAAFVDRLDAMNETQIGRTALHPRLEQPMRVIDMAVFVADHDDHHMARIRELARSVKGVAATRAR